MIARKYKKFILKKLLLKHLNTESALIFYGPIGKWLLQLFIFKVWLFAVSNALDKEPHKDHLKWNIALVRNTSNNKIAKKTKKKDKSLISVTHMKCSIPQNENPQILGLIPLLQIYTFLRFASPQIANSQVLMINPQIANPQISTKCCTTWSQKSPTVRVVF